MPQLITAPGDWGERDSHLNYNIIVRKNWSFSTTTTRYISPIDYSLNTFCESHSKQLVMYTTCEDRTVDWVTQTDRQHIHHTIRVERHSIPVFVYKLYYILSANIGNSCVTNVFHVWGFRLLTAELLLSDSISHTLPFCVVSQIFLWGCGAQGTAHTTSVLPQWWPIIYWIYFSSETQLSITDCSLESFNEYVSISRDNTHLSP